MRPSGGTVAVKVLQRPRVPPEERPGFAVDRREAEARMRLGPPDREILR